MIATVRHVFYLVLVFSRNVSDENPPLLIPNRRELKTTYNYQ
jgi:hypothetical protein